MKKLLVIISILLCFTGISTSYQHRSSSYRYHSRHSHSYLSGKHIKSYTPGLQRDGHGKIKRSSTAKERFMGQTGYPHGRPGYVVDHIIPLSKGGRYDPSNMRWQTKAEARAKDKWERR
jgi:hypothetical protein